jgi:V/A-type H+-transporting ATPase subunit I
MIVKMKKVSLVIFDKYREEALKQLRGIGVVHLDPLEGSGDQYDAIYSMNEKIKHALNILPSEREDAPVSYKSIEESLKLAEEISAENDELKTVKDRINSLLKEIERIEPFGDFDPSVAVEIGAKGLDTSLFMVNKTDESVFRENGAFAVAQTKAKSFFAVFGDISEALSSFELFKMPEHGLEELKAELAESREELLNIEDGIGAKTAYRPALKKTLEAVGSNLEFEAVRSGISVQETLSYLSGYCPIDKMDALKTTAQTEGWGLMSTDPAEDDEVPTQLKLGKFASLLEPVTDFLGILPGYREHDISFFFLCFFSVFTAMLIGDAGYGMLFLGVTVVGMISFGAKKKPIPKAFFLLLLLSVSTIIYGAVTGTWFASKSIMEISFFQNLKLDAFRGSDTEQIAVVMGISFFLGIVQLLIGVVQNFKKNFPKISSFAQIGWFAVLVAIYYLVLTLVVERAGLETYPTQMLYVLLGGVVVIFLFGGQEEGKSFIKGILNSMANFLQLFLDVVGTFSDIMSYVRLFAVGLASVKIAETFNGLGAEMSDGPMIIFGILIVILGHSINIVLGMMAILVHAVRLNILEYSGKVGVEWSGFKYEPFKVNTDEN